jgi:hypothetical protein
MNTFAMGYKQLFVSEPQMGSLESFTYLSCNLEGNICSHSIFVVGKRRLLSATLAAI